jgi:putative protease
LIDSAGGAGLEVVVHQHMPMFHMEFCVFCSVLSMGTDKTNCGRPCERHKVELRDRIGAAHPLEADVTCRNTVFNATAQSAIELIPALMSRGVRHVRIELSRDAEAGTIAALLALYQEVIGGRAPSHDAWRRLQPLVPAGVTRGTLGPRQSLHCLT